MTDRSCGKKEPKVKKNVFEKLLKKKKQTEKKKKNSKITSPRNKNRRQPFQNTAELKSKENKWSNLQETENKRKQA